LAEYLKNKVRALFAVCGNGEKPVGPAQKTAYIDNHLAKLCEGGKVLSKVFNGRITKALRYSALAWINQTVIKQLISAP
jgi:hypothetical protein